MQSKHGSTCYDTGMGCIGDRKGPLIETLNRCVPLPAALKVALCGIIQHNLVPLLHVNLTDAKTQWLIGLP